MATLNIAEGRAAFEARDARWNDLLDASGTPSFFLRPPWLAHWSAHTQGRRLLLATYEERGRWIAGLPLALGRGRVGRWTIDKLEIAGAPWFDQIAVPAVDDCAREAFLATLLEWCQRELSSWTLCELREIAAEDDSARAIERAARACGLPLRARVCSRAPYVDLSGVDGSGGEVHGPSKNLRSQLRRSEKRLAERGAIELAFARPSERECDALLDEIAAVEAQSWKGSTGVLQPSGGGAFFRPLVPELARARAWAVGTLRVSGTLVAYHWGFVEGRRFLSYNLAQLPQFDELGPGTFLLQHMVERARALDLDRVDASRGSLSAPHALARYGGPVREHLQMLVYNQNAAGRVLHATKEVLVPSLARLRRRFKAQERGP
ncbi:MAG: GNAT family N-acetyltransferase [Planctomycetota bacterium]